ncbi:Response regulator receiver domain-containing protein [Anoxynatronum buryatiense]|uniref:Stage 0 sporulation protein A homolog n=1 Tax=Anoxynatronum buryatiense TaxID=489973 RepID=A0AA45WTB7_9CLOT|nr:Response regulator receiver domain-containing protein [Anoxynatronum buryatiense]
MRILIAEDDLGSRVYMQHFLKCFGECDLTADGIETVDAFLMAWEEGEPYDLICLDIMMPKLDGLKVLKIIRDLEKKDRLKKISRQPSL